MYKKHGAVIAALLLLVLYSSASALVVNNTQTWTARTKIQTLSGGYLEIGPSGNLTITGRVDMDGVGTASPYGVCKLIMNGGTLATTETNEGVKFPDNYGPVEAWINAGTWTAARIQNLGWRTDRRPATIYIGGGKLIVQYGYNPAGENRDWNPVAWVQDNTLVAQTGYELKLTALGGGVVEIKGVVMSPADGAQNVPLDKLPSWQPANVTNPSYDVYLGTDSTAVQAADNTRGPCKGAGALLGDIDGDCSVNSNDLKHLVDQWLGAPSWPSADVVNDDNYVNLPDFAAVAGDWLDSNPFQGHQTTTFFNPGGLLPATWYYWRIDVFNDSTRIPGALWTFQTTPISYRQHVTVCADPGKFAGWPANNGVWSWGNEILVAFTQGDYQEQDGHNLGANEVFVQARSLDGGQSWTRENPGLSKGDVATPPPGGINFAHPDFALRSPFNTSGFSFSYDRGRTWQGPYSWGNLMADPQLAGKENTKRTDYMVNGPNDCFFFMSAVVPDTGMSDKSFVARTTDGGAAFQFVSWIVPLSDPYRAVMSSTVRCSPTKLVTALRRRTVNENPDYFWIDIYVSNDNGSTWSFLYKVTDDHTFNGNPPALVRLADGRLCCAYGNRDYKTINARFSQDEGATWGQVLILRDDYYPDIYNNSDLGYPRMVQRSDGKLVTMYYWQTQQQYQQQTSAIEATIWEVSEP
jgi:hypothetical protein